MPGWQFRPAKQMQRLMAVDAMRRLSAFRPLKEYRYVGMGGYEFVDFDLVRRSLGLHKMTSIERSGKQDRFKFNRPFLDIDLKFGNSNEMLLEVALEDPLIVWMDYCDPLQGEVLRDVLLLAENMQAGSMLTVSVNADLPEAGQRLSTFEGRVTSDRVPLSVSKESDLDSWKWADAQRRVLTGEVRRGLAGRRDSTRQEQILNIEYRDTNRMQTWGIVFVDPSHEDKFRECAFRDLEQFRPGLDPLRISVPVLTAREVLKLEEGLREGDPPPILPWLTTRESESFADLHRWYPRVPAPM